MKINIIVLKTKKTTPIKLRVVELDIWDIDALKE